MIPNIVRGERMAGLMTYLAGPGRANEHTEPHIVAGGDAIMLLHGDDELTPEAAREVAAHLDRTRAEFGTEISQGHVWHCSLSVRAAEGELGDAVWEAIAREFVQGMGFDNLDDPRASCPWVAVHHGLSKSGNDHIHIAVNLVRTDGTKANTWMDFRRAQKVCRELENKYELMPLESDRVQRATRGYHPAELEAEARREAKYQYEKQCDEAGVEAPTWEQLTAQDRASRIEAARPTVAPKVALARRVRAAATASQDEAEFVRRLRRQGLIVQGRLKAGTTDEFTGYSVGFRPHPGEPVIRYGGGRLGYDLSLSRLRESWADTRTERRAAAAEWTAARRGLPAVAPGRETTVASAAMWEQGAADLERFTDRMKQIPVGDYAAWSRVARETAGALSAWSNATETTPGPLAEAADIVSRSAQTKRSQVPDYRGFDTTGIRNVATLMASASRGGQGMVAQAAMLRELMTLTKQISQASIAAKDLRQGERELMHAHTRLAQIQAALPDASTRVAAQGSSELAAHDELTAKRAAAVAQSQRAQQSRDLLAATFGAAPSAIKPPAKPSNDPVPAGRRPYTPDRGIER